jgi:MFS family permease
MDSQPPALAAKGPLPFGFTSYQWIVLIAAWLGWGFDVMDGLLFNYVAPNCLTTLLHPSEATAKSTILFYTGGMTSLLLIGWAIGGLIFGWLGDKIGRTRTLLLTILLYAIGTACCALAPNIWVLMLFRFVAGLGIGGEWAAGAALVAEVVHEDRRVEAGALLYTSAPAGLFLATGLNYWIAGVWLKSEPDLSWRYVFASGLLPALLALGMRLFLKEPERWEKASSGSETPRLRDLFAPDSRRFVASGMIVAVTALIMWWSTNAFIPTIATLFASSVAKQTHLVPAAARSLTEHWKFIATSYFNWGGLIGTLLTIPAAKYLGRKPMFAIYFLASAASIYATFVPDWPPEFRLKLYFFDGLSLFGVFGAFTFYLPELFPTRLRASGAGFCYNIGRIVTAAGPFAVAYVASRPGADALALALKAQSMIGFVPLIGLLLFPFVIETKGKVLQD